MKNNNYHFWAIVVCVCLSGTIMGFNRYQAEKVAMESCPALKNMTKVENK